VKIVVQVRLLPDAGQAPALESTLPAVNEAANLVSAARAPACDRQGLDAAASIPASDA